MFKYKFTLLVDNEPRDIWVQAPNLEQALIDLKFGTIIGMLRIPVQRN